MKPRTFIETVTALYSVAWVWLHMYLIYIYGTIRIGEPNPAIITGELFASTVFLILWIVRVVREAADR